MTSISSRQLPGSYFLHIYISTPPATWAHQRTLYITSHIARTNKHEYPSFCKPSIGPSPWIAPICGFSITWQGHMAAQLEVACESRRVTGQSQQQRVVIEQSRMNSRPKNYVQRSLSCRLSMLLPRTPCQARSPRRLSDM